jgi:hypothetical protein
VESVDNGVPSAEEQYKIGDRGSKQQDCEQLEQAAEQRQQQQPADPNQRELVTEEHDRVERHPSRRFASRRGAPARTDRGRAPHRDLGSTGSRAPKSLTAPARGTSAHRLWRNACSVDVSGMGERTHARGTIDPAVKKRAAEATRAER